MSGLGNKEIFSRNLRTYIELSGKTRNEICQALGLSYSTFSEWVNGIKYPRIDKIEMLANYFEIKKSDLIEDPSVKVSAPESSSLDRIYLNLAKEAQEKGIDPDDIRLAIETINRIKKK